MEDQKFQLSFVHGDIPYNATIRFCYTLSETEREKLSLPPHGFWVNLYHDGMIRHSFALVMGDDAEWTTLKHGVVEEGIVRTLGDWVQTTFPAKEK